MIYIKDEEFIRGNCPMTKEEIRILSVAKLKIKENYRVLDIGAGTGSVAIQMAKECADGEVIAIEKENEALETLQRNIERFQCSNIKVIALEALEAEKSIEGDFDAIFVGGSGGNIEEIIKSYGNKLKHGAIMVLNFITIDNLYKAIETLKALNYKTECSQISVSKTRGNSYMLMANNPIFIVTAVK
ncbi:precorrin-6Y C5,15-methyltransferase, CbiT subunit [Clostridiales bacterium oral taxon 876 str. F0540]|nr:precorrin-6Y C5,15-methyltransferase, CbiT subunit [Clostridiales bacterium oral taxon 876 str. F0540]